MMKKDFGIVCALSSLMVCSCLGGSLKSSENTSVQPTFSISSALRYLSKAIFTDALTKEASDKVQSSLASASLQDSSDCVKRLICELRSKKDPLDWDEKLIMKAIPTKLDYASPIIQFELAADLGQRMPDQCGVVYSRCAFTATDVMVLMRQRGTSLDINTNEEYDCTVLFLWNKKLMTEKEDLESQDDT